MVLHKQVLNRHRIDWDKINSLMIKVGKRRYRDGDDVRNGILHYLLTHGPDRPTIIFFVLQTSHKEIKQHLADLAEEGLVRIRSARETDIRDRIVQGGRNVQLVEITNKGRKYLDLMDRLGELIEKPASEEAKNVA